MEGESFTSLVFGTNGAIGKECVTFISNVAIKLSAKQNEQYADIVKWIRTRLINSLLLLYLKPLYCVRGSRDPWYTN